mmetsp:Transcript_121662/g.181746  ORF Transcript_121662/g.181746 Transcript_121662/m.181746 type:complete len:97 (-) Transcript_121662:26-316(-)
MKFKKYMNILNGKEFDNLRSTAESYTQSLKDLSRKMISRNFLIIGNRLRTNGNPHLKTLGIIHSFYKYKIVLIFCLADYLLFYFRQLRDFILRVDF